MSTPKKTTRSTKRNHPLHSTSSSNVTEKKVKSPSIEDECEVCLVCDRAILGTNESTEGEDAVFCEGDCQGWLHCICASLSRPTF